ncbi:MAG: AAA family ATPase [Syntrophobacteraceae bacterium]
MLRKIRIKNYRTCKDVTIELNSSLLALVGRNASGKTNTLQAIYAAGRAAANGLTGNMSGFGLEPGFFAEFTLSSKKGDLIYSFEYGGKKNRYIKDSLSLLSDAGKGMVFSKSEAAMIDAVGMENPILASSEMSALRYLEGLLHDEDRTSELKELGAFQSIMRSLSSELARIKYYGVDRIPSFAFVTDVGKYEKWKDMGRQGGLSADEEFPAKFYDFVKNDAERFEEYKSIVVSLGLVERISFLDEAPYEGKTLAVILWIFEVNTMPLLFGQLSDGTKRVLILLFSLFYDDASVMLIEEPETSIHWGLLEKVLAVFRQYADDRVILFSTHSEQVLNQLSPEEIIYLQMKDGATQVKRLTGKQLEYARRFLSDVGPLGEYATSGGLEALDA